MKFRQAVGLDGGLIHLPFLAVGRVGALVVVAAIPRLPSGKRAAELDVVRIPSVPRHRDGAFSGATLSGADL